MQVEARAAALQRQDSWSEPNTLDRWKGSASNLQRSAQEAPAMPAEANTLAAAGEQL